MGACNRSSVAAAGKSLTDAREAAEDARKLVRARVDPVERKRAAREQARKAEARKKAETKASATTLIRCVRAYHEKHVEPVRTSKHAQQWINSIEQHCRSRYLMRSARQGGIAERKAMINRTHRLPIGRQAELVGISRATEYCHPERISEADLRLMRRIDKLHVEHPFAGSRMLRDLLRREGIEVGRRHVATLMPRMGIEALYRKPNTNRKHPAHPVYPYLRRGLEITRANQVWAMDIRYVPMARGFVYLAAVMDWHSRRVLAHRVSITMDTEFCIEALAEAITRYGAPQIMNTDQGSQFTSAEFIDTPKANGIAISMDGRGQWLDNVFVGRLWKSVKYEDVYLRSYETLSAAREGISRYPSYYNSRRLHRVHGGETPDMVYLKTLAPEALAA